MVLCINALVILPCHTTLRKWFSWEVRLVFYICFRCKRQVILSKKWSTLNNKWKWLAENNVRFIKFPSVRTIVFFYWHAHRKADDEKCCENDTLASVWRAVSLLTSYIEARPSRIWSQLRLQVPIVYITMREVNWDGVSIPAFRYFHFGFSQNALDNTIMASAKKHVFILLLNL